MSLYTHIYTSIYLSIYLSIYPFTYISFTTDKLLRLVSDFLNWMENVVAYFCYSILLLKKFIQLLFWDERYCPMARSPGVLGRCPLLPS